MVDKTDLAVWIRENPGATFVVDNDCWWVEDPTDMEGTLINECDVLSKGDGGYGSGNTYGGDILQALAEIVGVKIISV